MPKRPGRKRGVLYDKFGQEIIEEPKAPKKKKAKKPKKDAKA